MVPYREIETTFFFTTFDMDELNNSASMNLTQFLAVKLHQGQFKRGRSSLQDEFREIRPKLVVAPETINAVR